jgi:predicted ATPase
LAITRLNVSGYRSVRDVWLKLNQVNVIVGPNGCGKSNLYRAMYLVAATATGQFSRLLAEEGGMQSVLWAGERSKGSLRMNLGVRVERLDYKISVGLPEENEDLFKLDPRIKEEQIVFIGDKARSNLLLALPVLAKTIFEH